VRIVGRVQELSSRAMIPRSEYLLLPTYAVCLKGRIS
jgi:hypothetical protein